MKKIAIALSCIIILACNNEKKEETIKSYMGAHNAHDIEKALSYVDDNVVFDLKGVWVKEGKAAMKTLEKWDSTLHSNLRLESMELVNDTMYCKVVENNDWFRAVGITDLVHDPVAFVVEEGKISKIIAYPSRETGQQIEAAIGSLFQWSAQVQDSTIYELIKDGQFIYSAEAANRWMDLFDRRKESDTLQ